MARRTTIEHIDTVVIGAGQAGLSAGYHLQQRGLPFVILDADARIGDHWRDRWDSLKLYSPARYDSLPGHAVPGAVARTGRPAARWPTTSRRTPRGSTCRSGAAPASMRVEPVDGRLRRVDRRRRRLAARQVDRRDRAVPRARTSRRSPASSTRRSGSSTRTSTATRPSSRTARSSSSGCPTPAPTSRSRPRTPATGRSCPGKSHGQMPIRVTDTKRAMLGWPVVEFVFEHVLTMRTPMGRKMRPEVRKGGGPLLRVRLPDLDRAGVERHDAKTVGVRDGKPMLADGTVLDVANVIWATGYRPDYCFVAAPIVGEDGWPVEERGVSPTVPGLYFLGVPFQYAFSSMLVAGAGRDAKYVVERIAERVRATAQRRGHEPAGGRAEAGSGREVALRGADVADVGADQPVVAGLLEDVGRPAGVAGQRERRREEVRREADALQHRRRVVLDVRLERPLGVPLGEDPQRDVLDLDRELRASRACAPSPRRPCAAPRPAGRRRGRRGGRSPSAARRGRARRGATASACSTEPTLRELVDDLRRRAAVERPLHRPDRARRPPTRCRTASR